MKHTCHIRENSWLACLAAKRLRAHKVAVTIGKNIYLWNASKEDFLADNSWLRHELCHVKQYRESGFFCFLWRYIMETIHNGYKDNKFEIEARQAEKDNEPLQTYMFK